MKKIKKLFVLAMAPLVLSGCNPGTGDGGTTTCSHEYNDWLVEVLPTASTTGTASRVCGLCEDVEELTLPVLSDSSYQKGTDSATCQAAGQQEYTFTHEGKEIKFNVNTAKTGHNYVHHDATELTEQVITGTDEYYTCSMCSTLFNKNHEVIESLADIATHYYEVDATGHWHGDKASLAAHTYGAPVVDKEATYFEKGEQHKTCTACGYVLTEDIDMLSIGTLSSDVNTIGAASITEQNTTGPNKLVDGILALGSEDSPLDFGSGKINLKKKASTSGNVVIFDVAAAAKVTITGGSTSNGTETIFGIFDKAPNENADNFIGTPATTTSASNNDYVFTLPAAGRYYFGASAGKKVKITSISVEFHEVDTSKWVKDETGHWHSGADQGCMIKEDFAAHTFGEWVEVDAENDKRACTECGYEVTEAKALHAGCEHVYVAGVSQNSGKILYTCDSCRDTYEKDYAIYLPGEVSETATMVLSSGSTYTVSENSLSFGISGSKTPSIKTLSDAHQATMADTSTMSFTTYHSMKGQTNAGNTFNINVPGACKINVYYYVPESTNPRHSVTVNGVKTIQNVNICAEKPAAGYFGVVSYDFDASGLINLGTSSDSYALGICAIEVIY